MVQRFARHWPLWIAILILWGMVAVVFSTAVQRNGHFTYAFDDAYIHMAIAKHFAQGGVWGVTPFEFSSSSSSLLWTLLLAIIFKFIGVHETLPLLLNVILATALLVLIYHLAWRRQVGNGLRALLILLLPCATPIAVLIFAGMEHVLQTLIVVSMVFLAAETLASSASARFPWALCLLAAVLIATRYEGLFLLAALALLFTLRFRWRRGLLIGAGLLTSGLSVVFVYGAISISHGWYLLPNSVLVKGTLLNFSSNSEAALFMASKILIFSLREPALIIIVIGGGLLLITHIRLLRQQGIALRWEPSLSASVITILLTLLHLQFASVGAFFRYEGYLFVLGLLVLMVEAQRIRQLLPEAAVVKTGGWMVIVGAVLVLLVWRSSDGLLNVGLAMKNNHDQQYQMARFIATYYQNSDVVLNDIGAVNFFTDIHLTDTAALADKEVSTLILSDRSGKIGVEALNALMVQRHMQIALISLHEQTRLPPAWRLAATWTLTDGFIVSSATVGIYALVPEVFDALKTNLRDYAPHLPANVEVRILD